MRSFRRICMPLARARPFRITVADGRQPSLSVQVRNRTWPHEPVVLMWLRGRMPVWIAAWFILFSIVGWGRPAYAGVILFTDPQSFFQAARVVSTETFDELPSNTIIGVGSVTLDGITYTSANPIAQWYTSTSFVTPSPPNSLVQRNVIEPATLTFAGGGHTDAVGFFLRAGSNFPGGDYRFDVATASGETFTVDSGIIGGFIFREFVPSDGIDDGINSLSITPLGVLGGISNFFLDDVSRGVIASAIPEPSTLVLGTTGTLVLLAYALWQRTRRATS